jgi:broad-specificity NMP kinase
MIGLHYEDKIYGPLYFDYLQNLAPDDPIMQTRNAFEDMILDGTPESVLILVKASPDTIANRMRDCPHHRQVIQEHDIAHILSRFEDEFVRSKLPNKLVIDTTHHTVEKSVEELVKGLGPFFTEEDKQRLDSHKQA